MSIKFRISLTEYKVEKYFSHGSLFSSEINAGVWALLKPSRDKLFADGAATRYGPDGRGMGLRFRQEQENFIFSTAFIWDLRCTQAIEWVPGAVSLEVKQPEREADHIPPSCVKNDGAVTPLPNTLCLIKDSDNLPFSALLWFNVDIVCMKRSNCEMFTAL
jgi:hypothetical protein